MEILKLAKKFNRGSGPTSKDNTEPFQAITKILQKNEWQNLMKVEMRDLGKFWEQASSGWQEWTGKSSSEKGETRQLSSGELKPDQWNPYQACRIDIHTSFDANWYKRKFKSGLLNKMIFAIKTDARSHGTADMNRSDPMANHKYTADEMLPQDTRKLDSLQWKMTNKIARDFITYFMGWTRRKERNPDTKDGLPGAPTEELQYNESFGKKMADAALSNRGILGRLKQKIFSGGQSNNVISVAFQMADPNDGWGVVENGESDTEDAEQNPPEKGDNGGDTGNGESNGKSHGELGEEDVKSILTLLQRIKNLETQVFGKSADESTEKIVDDAILGYLEG